MARVKHTPASRKTSKKKGPPPQSQSPGTRARRRAEQEEQQVPGTQGRQKRRNKPGAVALREIRRFQKTCDLLIPVAPFIRCVKQITHQFSIEVTRWTPEAVVALQEAAEEYLVQLFQDGMLCAVHARRVTLMKKDFELARRLGRIGRPW